MSAKFFALLTVIGANKLAKATALGTTLKITQMAVGDGGGTLPMPSAEQTKLVNEKRRAGINTLFIDSKNANQIVAEQVIPENEGGYWIREIGLFDDEGSLIAVGNCPETYKPQLQEGSGRTQTIRMILTVSHTESVELKVDPSVILATRESVDNAIEIASKSILDTVEKEYATKDEVKKKFDNSNIVHEKGVSKEKVISQKGVTELFQPKGNYQPAGNYVTTETFNLEINKKIDKASLSQQLGNDVNKVPSLDLVTKELGNKQPKGNYALKSSKDHFQSGEHKITGNYATLILETADGASCFLEKNNSSPTPYIVNRDASGVNTSTIDIPNESGTLALLSDLDKELKNYQPKGNYATAGSSYTKAESDGRYQGKGNYQPAGNYALVGVSYTKAESDGKYQPKGNYALKSSKDNFQSGAHTITGKYATLHLLIEDGRRLLLEREPKGASYFAFKDAADRTTNQVIIPERSGTIALLSDIEGSNNIPVGSPIPWSLATAPSGYLICNGQTFNKSTYPKLAIAYPSGKLPDLRGEFIRGLDSGRGVDNERKVLSMQSGNSLLSAMWRGTVTGQQDWENKTSYNVEIGTNNSGYFTIGQQIEGSGSNETRPRNIAFLYIVRAA
ncbi:phage tail protein [Proteus mirabilis]|uniref:phage tail-collar fiber domain-containing protein n=1 Tax=Proteus mirabilis TaxID=584 RepID=UPI001F04D099|nr:phage tail protein [Proteus mirabilis]